MRRILGRTKALAFVAGFLHLSCVAPQPESTHADSAQTQIVPQPQLVDLSSTSVFRLHEGVRIAFDRVRPAHQQMIERFRADLQHDLGLNLETTDLPKDQSIQQDLLQVTEVDGEAKGIESEGYHLRLTVKGIDLQAADPAGLQYGLETLRQIITFGRMEGEELRLPTGSVEDAPRFAYRGMHLDVGRHFFGPEHIKTYLDLLARYKFNKFHWHLTEDQGWRLEIKSYPKLTSISSQRKETILEKNFDPYQGDGIPHGGFYTQDEIRELVAYAAERNITVIPEIELPGHSLAALAAYPELACTEGPFEVSTTWGVHEEIYCPGENAFEFLEKVLAEVVDLFPSELIHIGGDEAPKARWKASPLAQSVMERQGLATEEELQSYFIQRIQAFLLTKGRRIIGWDEILEGGLAPGATVMSWRGMDGGIEAARQGHDVVMTPTSHSYFDYYQGPPENEPLAIGGDLPLDKVYSFEPVPAELNAQEATYVLGAQGNVWTEYIKTWDHVEYMVLPRMLALSEVVWTPSSDKDYSRFLEAAIEHQDWLTARGYRTRPIDESAAEEVTQGAP